jgi:hypothetical protein
MAQVFLITEHKDLANSVHRYLLSKERIDVVATTSPRQLGGTEHESRAHWVPHTFSKLADWLETSAEKSSGNKFGLFNSICLIEVPSLGGLKELDPMDRTRDWPAVVGMLILAFPEVLWGLVTPYESSNPALARAHFLHPSDFCERLDALVELQKQGFSPLFDADGFRSALRGELAQRRQADYIPVRKERAVTIDEEESYAYFNAYVAYRFGFRCNVVTSYEMMTGLLDDDSQQPFSVSFEDVFLNFADRRMAMSRIEDRDKRCKVLPRIENRIFVTSGHSKTEEERKTKTENDHYLDRLQQEQRRYIKTLFKPGSGVFDLWKKSGLQDRLNDGKAPKFLWPPKPRTGQSQGTGTHSAPGRLLWISERLIARARQIHENVSSVKEAIYGATLTIEAQEYLGYRTPTASLDAIALKHQLEVLAESMFNGIEYRLDTKSRFKEIESEMDNVGAWFRDDSRLKSELNAEIGIVSDLVLTFRNYNQFSEEQDSLRKLRELHRKLWVRRRRWHWFFFPFRWYVDKLLASIPLFIGAIVAWLLVFALIYAFEPRIPEAELPGYIHGFEDSVTAFFGMQPPHDFGKIECAAEWLVWVTLFIILTGFVHLGIFVSHLYSIMSRR